MKKLITVFFLSFSLSVFAADITIGVNSLPTKSINIFARSTNQTQVLRQIYEPPFLIDENSKLQSPYFSKWSVKSSGKVYEFIVKDGLLFSDGSPIGPQQVANVFERTNPDGGKILQGISKVEIKGSVIHVSLKMGSYLLPEKLSDLSFAIISANKEHEFPVGSGAFKIQTWNEKSIGLERNQHHRDIQSGNIKKVNVKLLDKSVYSLGEITKEAVDFFPLVQITLQESERPAGFKRVIYPSHRVNILVINVKEEKIRSLLSKCIDPARLLDMPYFKNSTVAYNSIVPSGLENYIPKAQKTRFSQTACDQERKKWKGEKTLRWLNAYTDDATKESIARLVLQLNTQLSPLRIEVLNKTLQEAQEIISRGEFNLFICGVGSPYPLAEGMLSDFVYSRTDKNKLIHFEDVILKKLFASYQSSEDTKRTKLIGKIVDHLVNSGWVIPFGRRVDTFLIPEKWKNLSMVNGMNGNFYLGKLYVEQN